MNSHLSVFLSFLSGFKLYIGGTVQIGLGARSPRRLGLVKRRRAAVQKKDFFKP